MSTKKQFLRKAFTLVELIIVIAIIAILSVLAFLQITKRVKISRDTSRTADLTTIEKALNIALVEKSKVPLPDENITITASGDVIGYQGVFGETVKDFIGNISNAPQDGADKIYYTYYVDKTQKYFQLLGFAENKTSYNPNNANAVDYSQRYILTRGNKLGIIVDGSQTPINQLVSEFDVMTGIVNDTGYTAIFDSNNKLSGTGQTLQWLWSNVNNGGAGYNSPSNCPTGFIPVPGNKDFNQPGFCVAKYEMKQINGTAGNNWRDLLNVWHRTISPTEICGIGSNGSQNPCYKSYEESGSATDRLNGKIESKAEGLPIVHLNQSTAIEACSKMGAGYHLITNKERMVIARNIEQQGENRTGGKVGVGGIYRGNNNCVLNYIGNTNPNDLNCGDGTDYMGKHLDESLIANGNSKSCEINSNGKIRNKRALVLSNSQRIWDLNGNVLEFVNKANTIDGAGFDLGKTSIAGCSNPTGNSEFNTCSEIGNGPSNLNFTTINGIGSIYTSEGTDDNIFVRGGHGGQGTSITQAGIFAIDLSSKNIANYGYLGFRCAR